MFDAATSKMPPRWLGLAWLCSVVSLLLSPSAEAQLDVANGLRGVPVGSHIAVLEDALGRFDIAAVSDPERKAPFAPAQSDTTSLGYTDSVYWVRLDVRNSAPTPRAWLLELAYPQLDEVTLFLPRPEGGFTSRTTGDTYPFSQRDVAYRNFVFTLEEPPASTRAYYLRVATTGVMNLPLIAWTTKEFIEHQHLDWAALCIFYGVVLVMIAYQACVYAFTRQAEYLSFVGFMLAIGILQFTIAGHTFQFLLPNDTRVVHELIPASTAAAIAFACLVVQMHIVPTHPQFRLMRLFSWYFSAWIPLSFVLPYAFALRGVAASAMVPLLNAIVLAAALKQRHSKDAMLFLAGWGSTIIGATIYLLQTAALLPSNFFTTWSIQIGLSLQLVLVSSALADQLNTARRALTAVNSQLSHKLEALSTALAQAEQATKRAERAMRVKDEFLATMSHEFRTPLNPVINLPQAISEGFMSKRFALCEQCRSNFELDATDQVSETTSCPECGTVAALLERGFLCFTGDPLRARRALITIERSGVHLLRLVNDILDYSKMEAGKTTLARKRFDVAELVRSLVAELNGELAVERVQLANTRLTAAQLYADPQRLRDILKQLIDNGLKFSEQDSKVMVDFQPGRNGCLFTVRDFGIGISKEDLEMIFDSFEQVSKGNTRRYRGTGLGLSISRSLVRMHGGELRVESTLGRGSVFSFVIPCAPDLALAPGKSA